MRLECKKLLADMQRAGFLVQQYTKGKTIEDYRRESLLRAGVERQFEIIGEALARLVKLDASTAQRISEYRRIISFRNVLIHGYDAITDSVVWDIMETKLPALLAELTVLLKEPETP